MKSAVSILVPALALFAGCVPPNKLRVPDVTQPADLVLVASQPDRPITQLSLVLSGRVDGRAHIWAPGVKTQVFSGSFHITTRVPWTSTNAVLQYVPEHVTGGGVLVRYAFEPQG